MTTTDLKAGAPCVSVIEVLTDPVPAWLVVEAFIVSFDANPRRLCHSLSNGGY